MKYISVNISVCGLYIKFGKANTAAYLYCYSEYVPGCTHSGSNVSNGGQIIVHTAAHSYIIITTHTTLQPPVYQCSLLGTPTSHLVRSLSLLDILGLVQQPGAMV